MATAPAFVRHCNPCRPAVGAQRSPVTCRRSRARHPGAGRGEGACVFPCQSRPPNRLHPIRRYGVPPPPPRARRRAGARRCGAPARSAAALRGLARRLAALVDGPSRPSPCGVGPDSSGYSRNMCRLPLRPGACIERRRRPESNWCKRLCRPLRSHSATAPGGVGKGSWSLAPDGVAILKTRLLRLIRIPGRLAQLGERLLDKQGVTGSSPVPPMVDASPPSGRAVEPDVLGDRVRVLLRHVRRRGAVVGARAGAVGGRDGLLERGADRRCPGVLDPFEHEVAALDDVVDQEVADGAAARRGPTSGGPTAPATTAGSACPTAARAGGRRRARRAAAPR